MPVRFCILLLLTFSQVDAETGIISSTLQRFEDVFKNISLPPRFNLKDLRVLENLTEEIYDTFVPTKVESSNLNFTQYLPNNESVNLKTDTASLNPEKSTVFLIHGFSPVEEIPWLETLGQAYHETGDYNIVIFNWTVYSGRNYVYAAAAVEPVGSILAEFIENLHKNGCVDLNTTHMVGHSLGAHVAGVAGRKLANSGLLVDKMTGLDPARPLFETYYHRDGSMMLDKGDAGTVIVVHTNCGEFGVCKSYGDVDIFVNGGGPTQPMCEHISWLFLLYKGEYCEVLPYLLPKVVSCSHQAAHAFYEQALKKPADYGAIHCKSHCVYKRDDCDRSNVVLLTGELPKNATGNYYLDTRIKGNDTNPARASNGTML